MADTDTDSDGVADCRDNCPQDPGKTEPGICGCGVADTDSDGDGTPDCNDLPGLHVAGIQMRSAKAGRTWRITAAVVVVDQNGQPAASARVSAQWNLPSGGSLTQWAATDRSGRASFMIASSAGTYQVRVTSVAKRGWDYWPGANVKTEDSITVP